jgi:hypothetical protein
MGKGKVHYIEVISDSDGEEEVGRAQGSEHSSSYDEKSRVEDKDVEKPHVKAKFGFISTLSGVP